MPRAARDFSPIYTSEQVALSFDFSLAIQAGTTLSSPTVTISLVSGIDATPNARLIGGPAVVGNSVVQMVGSLQPAATYDILATVLTSTGETLQVNAHQACQSEA